MSSLTKENIPHLCRACLRKLMKNENGPLTNEREKVPAYYHIDRTNNLHKWMTIINPLEDVTRLKTNQQHKQFPQYVCRSCYENFRHLNDFKEMVVHSFSVLSKLLADDVKKPTQVDQPVIEREVVVKSEPIDDYDDDDGDADDNDNDEELDDDEYMDNDWDMDNAFNSNEPDLELLEENANTRLAFDYPSLNEEDVGDYSQTDSEIEPYGHNEIISRKSVKGQKHKSIKQLENPTKRAKGQESAGLYTAGRNVHQRNSRIANKQIGPMCSSSFCVRAKSRHCQEFDEETRKKILKDFWSLSWESKKAFVNKHVIQIKTRKSRVQASRKQFSFLFKLPHKHGPLQVCRSMFMSTLSIKSDVVKSWLNTNSLQGKYVECFK